MAAETAPPTASSAPPDAVNGDKEAAVAAAPAVPFITSPPEVHVPSIAQPVQADDPDVATGVRRTPFMHPAKGTQIPAPAELTTEQQTAYNSVLNTVAAWTHVPVSTAKDAEQETITEREQQWLTRECLLRYLRATKWDIAEATVRLQSTLAWRREYGLHGGRLTSDYISVENETGKQWLMGYDVSGRPCHYLNPSRQNTERSDRQIEHLVFMMERDIDIMPPGQETLALLINFAETSRGQGATVGQGRQVLSILQAHYPERLGRALLTNLPWFFWAFMKVITPFIDPLTRQKLVYNDDLTKHVPPHQLLKSHGGDVEFEYEHGVYWPALNALAAERRQLVHERWVAGGKRVGEYEAYLKGGQDDGLAAIIAKQEAAEREKRPPAQRSGTNRSGGLKVERADGDEQQHQQRPRKSVSIYEDKEGHEGGATESPAPILKTSKRDSAAPTATVATAKQGGVDKAEQKREEVGKDGQIQQQQQTVLTTTLDTGAGGGQAGGGQAGAQPEDTPTSPTRVNFGDAEGNPLPADAGTGKRETSPGRAPRRMSNPKPPPPPPTS